MPRKSPPRLFETHPQHVELQHDLDCGFVARMNALKIVSGAPSMSYVRHGSIVMFVKPAAASFAR
jgi:hypothetical protein